MTDPLIAVDNLSFCYGQDSSNAIQALDGVSLLIERGSYAAVIGHNGSGKSTLAKCLNGLLLPDDGSVTVEGMDTREPGHRYAIRALVGMVFQNPDNQFVATTVAEEAAFGGENLGVPRRELLSRLTQALADTGLSDLAERNPSTLSAGQKARLAIASILVMRPACLVLDESTALLAPRARQELLELIDRLHAQGLAIVLITHQMDEVVRAESVHVLDEGRLAVSGTPQEVLLHPALAGLGLDLPPAAQIAAGLRQRGLDLPDDTLDRAQLVRALLDLHEARE